MDVLVAVAGIALLCAASAWILSPLARFTLRRWATVLFALAVVVILVGTAWKNLVPPR